VIGALIPRLLVTFFAATVAMVGAIVVMAGVDSDWADAGAIVLLLGVGALLVAEIAHELRDDDEP
jgi:uncharacterized membrane protein